MQVIQLCEAAMLCTGNATAYVRIKHRGRTSRPIGCCAECLPKVRAQVASEGMTISETPIPKPAEDGGRVGHA